MDELTQDFMRAVSQKSLSFKELFPDDFIKEYTRCSSLDEFLRRSGFNLQTQEQLNSITTEQWNAHVRAYSDFKSFQDMKQKAVDLWLERKL